MFRHPRFRDCLGSSPSAAIYFSQEFPPEPGISAREGQGADRSTRDLHAPAYRFDDEPPDLAEDTKGQRSDRDLPLSFCWTAATNWTAMLDLPPLPMKHQEARDAILLEAVLAHHWNYPAVSYGRRRAFYAKKRRYHGSAFTYRSCLPRSTIWNAAVCLSAGPLRV